MIFIQLNEPINTTINTVKGTAPSTNHFICFLKPGLLINLIEFINDMMTMLMIPVTRNNLMLLNNQSVNASLKNSIVINIEANPRTKVEMSQIEFCL